MPLQHEQFLAAVVEQRDRLMSRRGFLARGSAIAGGALALSFAGGPGMRSFRAFAKQADFKDDLDVLNYALTLENLEYAFYRDGIGKFSFGMDPFEKSIDDYLMAIRDHEGAHVETLRGVITQLKGTPVEEATYDFGYGGDPMKFLATAAALENTGVMAYDGAGQFLKDPDLLTAAVSIVAVEARYASYLNLINGTIPYPDGFEQAKAKDEILAVAGPFIVA
jgi:Ferritin-like domain